MSEPNNKKQCLDINTLKEITGSDNITEEDVADILSSMNKSQQEEQTYMKPPSATSNKHSRVGEEYQAVIPEFNPKPPTL